MKFLIVIGILGIAVVSADEQALKEFTKANNLFTSSAYKEVLKKTSGNFLVSPLSAETILALAQSGCKDETASELRNALHLPDDNTKIENGIKTLLPQLKGGDNYALYSANKMYVKEGFTIRDKFKNDASEVYQAESENIDFIKKEEAAKIMNDWVEKNTNNKIHNLVDSNKLNNRTRVILINALYFKADWLTKFLIADSQKGKFYKTENEATDVDMMYHYSGYKDSFNYYECHHLDAKLIELPFEGNDAFMTIILPNKKDGIIKLEKQLDWVFTPHNFTKEVVNLGLPKFKIESEIDFKEVLENLGVTKAFHKEFADLTGIAGKKGDLVIDQIAQKTFIDVSEEGVEAAAATYVVVAVPMSADIRPPKNFIADHPFIFYIKVKNVIVFAGRVTDPNA